MERVFWGSIMNEIKRDLFKPVTPKRNFEDISDQIKHLIYSRSLRPKDRLPSERELAEHFNTGRMSVREALRMLEATGFVHVKKGMDGGIFVRELDETGMTQSLSDLVNVGNITLHEIEESRIIIESIILESGINHFSKKQLASLESNINACEQYCQDLIKDEHSKAWDYEIGKFHVLIAETSKNRLLKYFVASLLDLYINQIIKATPGAKEYARHLEQHREIFEAIKAKDLQRAKRALRRHVCYTTTFAEENLKHSRKGVKKWQRN
jgi:DNA-binding FadR family transcriptional regulator